MHNKSINQSEGEGDQVLMINGNIFELLEPGGKCTSTTHSHVLLEKPFLHSILNLFLVKLTSNL